MINSSRWLATFLSGAWAGVILIALTSCHRSVAPRADPRTLPQSSQRLRGFPTPVPDGSLVLLKNGNNILLVMVDHQSFTPEACDFTWYARKDGQVPWVPDDNSALQSGTETGHAKSVLELSVIGFDLQWSGNRQGFGYIYYPATGFMAVACGVKLSDATIAFSGTPLLRDLHGTEENSGR